MAVSIGLLIGVSALLYYQFVHLPQVERERLNRGVKLEVAYIAYSKNTDYPLRVSIYNSTNRTLTKVEWRLDVFRPGYSTDLSGFDDDYSSDRILKPGESWVAYYKLPRELKTRGVHPTE